MNRGVEIDGRVADSAGSLIEHAGAVRASSCGWLCSTTCSRAARSASARLPQRRSPDALGREQQQANVVVRGARVLDPAEGIDATLDVRIDDGVIAAVARTR